jgi:hypothetical protein
MTRSSLTCLRKKHYTTKIRPADVGPFFIIFYSCSFYIAHFQKKMGLRITTNTGPPNGVRPRPISTRTAGLVFPSESLGLGQAQTSPSEARRRRASSAARHDVGVRGSERRARQPALGGWLEAVRRKTEPDCLKGSAGSC